MQDIIKSLLSDGQGNSSMMRLITFIMVVSVLGTKFYNAWLTKTPIVWDASDLALIGGSYTAKLIQNSQEK